MNTYGKQVIASLSDGQTLPNAGAVDSTNIVYIGGNTNGKLQVNCYAKTAISIATDKLLTMEIQTYSAATAASARPPFTYTSTSPATRSFQANCHVYPLHHTTADSQLDFAAGNLMWQWIIPTEQLWTDTYLQVEMVTDANESSETVDIFISGVV